MTQSIKLNATMSLSDMGGAAGTVRAFAQAVEGLGYDGLGVPDHVLGANVASRPDWGARNTSADLFHDPFVLFGFLSACTTRLEFSTQVLILAQRQTALVAKQAASLAVLSEGRLRLGVGVGWNPVEFEGLNEDFSNRGRRSQEQVEVMRALWAQPHVDVSGKWHRINDAGINPRPPGGHIPLWFGGHADATLRRIALWGDGWIMLEHPPSQAALDAFERLRGYVRDAGRDSAEVGLEVWTSVGEGDEDSWRRDFQFWKDAGVTHITLNNAFGRYSHKRMPGRTVDDHIAATTRYWNAVSDLR
ncbi:MAG: putative F420-dependent oxidoreductase [Gammaproteobacteria bacterium]|jgi:probable F420-dependent oxidoreductase